VQVLVVRDPKIIHCPAQTLTQPRKLVAIDVQPLAIGLYHLKFLPSGNIFPWTNSFSFLVSTGAVVSSERDLVTLR
jgi:hypothetical protein